MSTPLNIFMCKIHLNHPLDIIYNKGGNEQEYVRPNLITFKLILKLTILSYKVIG